MRLYEFEAKDLYRKAGIPVPEGQIALTPEEAGKFASEIKSGKIIVKAQALTGGRGKAGGIKIVSTAKEAEKAASDILTMTINGFPVRSVLIEQALQIKREIYVGVTIDRIKYKIVLIGSSQGGMEIEEIARTHPDKIVKMYFDPDEVFHNYHGIQFGKELGLSGITLLSAAKIAGLLIDVFRKYETKLAEINPLAVLEDETMIAADARMSVDEDALFRHPELSQMGLDDRHEEGEMTEREKEARDKGIPYLDLDGNIGMFPGGAGFGIAGNDLIIDLGGKPANFMDSGGGPTPERLSNMLMLLQDNPDVKAIFAARFGGVSRCDDYAKGVIQFLRTGKLTKPIVMRMTGNAVEEGVRLFEEEKKNNPEVFKNIEIYGIETPIEFVAKRAVEMARIEEEKIRGIEQ